MDENASIEVNGDESAEEKLTRLEQAQEAEFAASPSLKEPVDKSLQTADRPAEVDKNASKSPSDKPDEGIPSEAEKLEVDTAKAEAEKEGKELELDDKGVAKRDAKGQFVKRDKAPEPVKLTPDEEKKFAQYLKQTQSKFGDDLGKRLVRWDKIKEAEKALEETRKGTEGQLQGAIKKFNADVAAFRAEQDNLKPTPEKYEQWANGLLTKANDLEAQAKKAEDAAEYDKAEKLKDEAKFARRDAQSAKDSADHLRKNPPATLQQQQAQFQTNQKEWINKAAVDFPEFGKKDSIVQKEAADYFKSMVQEYPEAGKLPGFIYFCAERAAFKTASDRVPNLEKELGELKKKLTEYELLTSPNPGGGANRLPAAKSYETMSSEEQFAQLRQDAASM